MMDVVYGVVIFVVMGVVGRSILDTRSRLNKLSEGAESLIARQVVIISDHQAKIAHLEQELAAANTRYQLTRDAFIETFEFIEPSWLRLDILKKYATIQDTKGELYVIANSKDK
jgi:hypothetical protein